MTFSENDGELIHLVKTKSEAKCESKDEKKLDSCVCRSRMQKRHILAIWAFFGIGTMYAMRVGLSVALVAMVNNTASTKNESQNNECIGPNYTTKQDVGQSGEFSWNEKTQGWVLGAFFYGYIITQIPGGYLATRFGAKRLLAVGLFCTSTMTMLIPMAGRLHVGVLIVLRVVGGLGEGVTFPGMYVLWGNWAPTLERSQLTGFVIAGSSFGIVFGMPISGILCDSRLLGGWPSVFYVFGGLGLLWFVFWMWIIHETPADHPTITKAERQYIEESIGEKEYLPTPWKKILTCPALWGIAAAHFAENWLLYMILTSLPTYMKNILKFDMKSIGFLSGMPYLLSWFIQMVSSYFADYLRANHYLSTQRTRQLFTTAGFLIPAVLIVGVGYTGCDHTLAVVLLALTLGTSALTTPGYVVNPLDIAPKFAGILLGITNTVATIPGFVAPIVVGVLTNHNETSGQWRIIFFISAGIILLGAAIFALLARGEEMPWSRKNSETDIIIEP
ncbi:sialin-like [Gigantopelta aegis]|uniref:sialin-like n=1 Tax=Gigantopelta aegis TaxID=1735272 RepID=UPI001B888CC8|nr:sialin-like [Gigantopelta aegis]